EVITFLVSMQISISSLQTHNVNRCGRSRHLARKLSLRRKRSSPNVFEMAATETERPLKDIRDEYNYPKKKGIKDECSRLLEASTMKSRRGFAIQRLMNAMRQAHADGWFIVFDTLTLADDRLEAFYDNPNALR